MTSSLSAIWKTAANVVQCLFLFIVTIGVSSGCSKDNYDNSSLPFVVTFSDTVSFLHHNVYSLEAPDDSEYVLISSKTGVHEAETKLGSIEEIQVGRTYELSLSEYTPPPELEFFIRSANINYHLNHDLPGIVLDSSNLLWVDGRFFKHVYSSEDVIDRYVRRRSSNREPKPE